MRFSPSTRASYLPSVNLRTRSLASNIARSPLLIDARDKLASQVMGLQEVLQLQKQYAHLSTKLTTLQASLKEKILAPPPGTASGGTKKKTPRGIKSKTLAFPVITRSTGSTSYDPPTSTVEEPPLQLPKLNLPPQKSYPQDSGAS